jgi:CheY-like chemotaxis protein
VAKPETGLVYVIDDDASLRRSLRNLLRSVGWRVETFESAKAFLQSDSRHHTACLIVDLRMPGMSGLDLLGHLTSSGSPHAVVLLTGHGNDAIRQRSLRAGAVEFLEKPFESVALLDAVRKAMFVLGARTSHGAQETAVPVTEPLPEDLPGDRTVRVAGGTLARECHICAFFNGIEEQHRVLRSFIKEGLDSGDKSFHIVDPRLRDDHLTRLSDAGIDAEKAMATGQLDVRTWEEAYLHKDRFEQDAMLHLIEDVLRSNGAAGYAQTRIVAQMEWALLDKPGVDDLIEYETRVNYVLPRYSAPTICAYDLSKFSASVIIDVMRTHPMVIIGGVLQDNPFFVSPDQFLLEIRERRSHRRSASAAS